MKRRMISVLAVVVLTASCADSQSQQEQQHPGPMEVGENIAVVSTTNGDVRGYIDDGVFGFKGIPYAQAERFMPPEPPDPWDGVLQTTIWGPRAMQAQSRLNWNGQSDVNFGKRFPIEPMDEHESFVLNVWTNGINDGGQRPVWVWIHGGGYSAGSANQQPFFDGRSMASKGEIVVVSVNHRLNVLGYLDLRGLGGKYAESVNLGQQDLVAALQWVHDNIANFGGDPGRVTIDGQSGGGGKVSVLMAMPPAAGLFHGAIVQSGSTLSVSRGEDSKAYGLAFAQALGVTPENTEGLNDFTYEELVAATQRASQMLAGSGGGGGGRGGLGPTVDGKYISQNPFDPAPAEFSKDVPMIIGSNLNESGYADRSIITPQTMEQVRATLSERYGAENVEKYIQAYQEAYPNDDQPQHILTTNVRTNPLRQAAVKSEQGGAPAYLYLFQWKSPVNEGSLGAAHGMELPFMFNNIAMARPLTGGGEEAYALADKVSSAWISFIKTGDPNNNGALPEWPPYTPNEGATMVFDNDVTVRNHHDKALIDLVSSLAGRR